MRPQPRIFNHQMRDAAPPEDQVWNFDEASGDTRHDPRFSLGIETYPGRVLGATEPCDVIQLPRRLKSEWEHIVAHYARVGLSHTVSVVWDDTYEIVRNYPEHDLSTFLFGERAHAARPDVAWYDIVRRMNSKNAFVRLARRMGVPVPDTLCFDRRPDVLPQKLPRFPLYLKADVSVSGRGVVRCNDRQDLVDRLVHIDRMVPFQLQEEVDAVDFLNVQYEVTGDRCERLLVTEQILNGNAHSGNRYPTEHVPWDYTDPLAAYMHECGMRDVFAFDLAVDRQGGYALLECNPRYNGATYPTMVARKLGIGEWSAVSVHTRARALSEVDLGSVEYDPETGCGVVLVNWGAVQQGTLGVLFAGPVSVQKMAMSRLTDLLL